MKKTKMEKGITLIALIITIVVLLILATVAITSIQNNGIIAHTENATKEYNQAQENEQDIMDYFEGYLSGNLLSQQITAENYGDPIDYTAPNGVTGWKVFYNDGTNVFIILDYYLENQYLPSELNMTKEETYRIGWDVYEDGDAAFKNSSSADINKDKALKYQLSWLPNESKSTESARAVADLFDDVWSDDFADETLAESAIGGPTLDMWVKSWNSKGYTRVFHNSIGGVSTSDSIDSFNSWIDLSAGDDDLYFLPEEDYEESEEGGAPTDRCIGYFFAYPCEHYGNTDWMVTAEYGTQLGFNYRSVYTDWKCL